MAHQFIPDRGDIIWINFNPQSGRDQAGMRPVLVISPKIYNLKVGLALCCPITSKIKGYPFEVVTPKNLGVSGAILVDHIKSLDWKSCLAKFECKAGKVIMNEVAAKLATLIY